MTRLALSAEAPWWELWRLWTCHLVHYSAAHLALNILAALPPVLLVLPAGSRRNGRQDGGAPGAPASSRPFRWLPAGIAIWLLIAAPLISLAILLIAKPFEYRGASALVMGLWFLVPLSRQGTAGWQPARLVLPILATIKLLVETVHPFGDALPLAHWLGAAAGLIGAAVSWRTALRPEARNPAS